MSENKLLLCSDLIKMLVSRMSEYGDIPVFISDKDSIHAMTPVKSVAVAEAKPSEDKEGELFALIANFEIIAN